ncbi:MAG TPA: MBL fold metallo-hydrolase [Verrucomicrobiae bacterium]|jgi:beta-lactamase superfamily II metal-dependent hydrolase|nr:MBL fold metallo-hydrolase [Verrucomicrobiae bacterium]
MTQGFLRTILLFSACVTLRAAEGPPLDMYWVDVEGGAGTLIVTPAGESIVIDTGMPGGRDAKRIAKAAKDAGLRQIDYLFTTHLHMDHFGGAAELSEMIPIVTVYDNGIPDKNPDNPADTAGFEKSIRPYREMKVQKRVVIHPGDVIPLKQADSGAKLELRCIAAMQQTIPGHHGAAGTDCAKAVERAKDTGDNANSIVLLLKFGDFKMFDGGDLTWNNEAKLVCPENLVGHVDIYDVDHHGLDLSNNPILVHSLAPTVAIMSNGTSKGCGAETFHTLKNTSSIQAIYQIHRNLRPDSENNTEAEYIANPEKDCEANYIKVSVEPSGKSYTVSIPTKGHSRMFQTR